jgi:hypothetical protein
LYEMGGEELGVDGRIKKIDRKKRGYEGVD